MDKINVSVIIPCYNCDRTLADQLEALSRQTYNGSWELIIADNGSTDTTVQIAETYREKGICYLKIIDASDIQGASYARNCGVDHAEGELILYCDSDDLVEVNWIEEMVKALHEYDIVAPEMEHFMLSDERFAKLRAGLQTSGLIGNDFDTTFVHAGASGLGVRKEVHNKIGGFDIDLMANEDWDYCWKAQMAGYTLKFMPTATIHIRHCSSLKEWIKQAYFWGTYYPLIVKKYESHGIAPPGLNEILFNWKKLLSNYLKIGGQLYQDELLWKIFYTLGKIKGSVKFRKLVF